MRENHCASQFFARGWECAALWRGPLLSTKTPRPCAILNDLGTVRSNLETITPRQGPAVELSSALRRCG